MPMPPDFRKNETQVLNTYTMYKASQQLIDILLSNGFKEHTSSSCPEHWDLLQEKGFYDPQSVKRDLRFRRLTIFFNYINICIRYNSAAYYKTTCKLLESEIKSLILFTKLPTSLRTFLKHHNVYPTGIIEYIEKYNDEDLAALPSRSRETIKHLKQLL